MAMTALPFRGATFYRDVRDRTPADHGRFVGSDGDLRSEAVLLSGTSRLALAAATDNPAFTASLEVRGTAGSLRLAASGAVLELTDLGTPNIDIATQLRQDLELTADLLDADGPGAVLGAARVRVHQPPRQADARATPYRISHRQAVARPGGLRPRREPRDLP